VQIVEEPDRRLNICLSLNLFIAGDAEMPSSFLFLVTALVFGFATSTFAPNPSDQSPVLKTEGLSSPPTVSREISIRVLWTITGYKVGENAAWREEEARKLLFKPLDIDANKITFDGRTCRDVIFEKEKVNAKEYLDHVYHTTPRALNVEEEVVEVIKTNCDLPGFAEYIRLRDSRLIIHINGVFFYLEPAVNY